jgi:uncharacterized membrane protein
MQILTAVLLTLPAWFSLNPLLSYLTAVVFLVIGVSIAIKNAPPQTNWVETIVPCGPVFIGVPMAVFGLDHYFFPAGVAQIIPRWIPAHTFWVYFVGTCLILGGISIVFRTYPWLAAGLFGVMLLCFEATMNIPGVVKQHDKLLIWTLCVREFSFSMGALSFAAMHTQQWREKGTHRVITVARIALGIALTFFGVLYFIRPELLPGVPLQQLTPNFIPAHLLWGYLTGVVYVVAGVCLLINQKARLAATWVGLFVLFGVIFLSVPYMLQYVSDINRGLNVPADNLMFCGALLCLAGSLRRKSAPRM